MKCETCKYWGVPYRDGQETDGVFNTKRCGKAIQQWDAGSYENQYDDVGNKTGIKFDLKPEYKEQKMFVKDGSDYMADLFTTADFFCAHYEVK